MSRRPVRRRSRRKVIRKPKPAAGKAAEPEEVEEVGDEPAASSKAKAAPKPAKAPPPAPPGPPDPLVGKTLGKCRIEALIGKGRTATVYRAHYEPLNRTVALKVLLPEMVRVPAVVRIFQKEAHAVAALDHENVLKIYDVGEDAGYHYIVLELLKGKDLYYKIEAQGQEGLPVDEAVDFVRQAAAGLAAAHRKGLIHRDIKPQNLVVEPDGTLKIVDFGLAAEVEGAFSGGRLGTPHFMAPEQCRGENAVPTSDIYSLGITFFHMLVGRPPFAGKQSKEEILQAHLESPRLEPEKIRKDIPRPVADLVRKMTRKDPAARPTAEEVFELATRLGSAPMRPAGPRSKRKAFHRARRASSSSVPALIVGGCVLAAIVLFFALRGGKSDSAPPPASTVTQAPPPSPEPTGGSGATEATPPKTSPVAAAPTGKAGRLLAQAKVAEDRRDYQKAYALYQEALREAEDNSPEKTKAEAGIASMKRLLPSPQPPPKTKVTDKEKAAIEKSLEDSRSHLARLELTDAKVALHGLEAEAGEGTDIRARVDAAERRVGYVEGLLKLAEDRAAALTGPQAKWSTYQFGADPGLTVVGANGAGIQLKKEGSTLPATTRKWKDIPENALIAFFDAMRHPSSPDEALWLGYFCQLRGNDLADRYYDFVTGPLNGGPDLVAEVKALRAQEH